jgi:hypothetical protein
MLKITTDKKVANLVRIASNTAYEAGYNNATESQELADDIEMEFEQDKIKLEEFAEQLKEESFNWADYPPDYLNFRRI